MIYIVDDDPSTLERVESILLSKGYQVRVFSNVASALSEAEGDFPELILSDIIMPEIDGFGFREEYERRFAHRLTPFIFLSSLSSDTDIVRGLEHGVDDYLTKPIDADVLYAVVKKALQRKERYSNPSFVGDLSRFRFQQIMDYFETKGLTGIVDVGAGSLGLRIHFEAGHLNSEKLDEARIEALLGWDEGEFKIYCPSVDFSDIEHIALAKRQAGKPAPKITAQPARSAEAKPLDFSEDFKSIEEELHKDGGEEEKTSDKKQFDKLFEEGFDRYRAGNSEGALEVWQQAATLDLDNKVLQTNIEMLKKKLKKLTA